MEGQWSGGKGSTLRPMQVKRKRFEDNWDKIFNKKQHDGTITIPSNETNMETVKDGTI